MNIVFDDHIAYFLYIKLLTKYYIFDLLGLIYIIFAITIGDYLFIIFFFSSTAINSHFLSYVSN